MKKSIRKMGAGALVTTMLLSPVFTSSIMAGTRAFPTADEFQERFMTSYERLHDQSTKGMTYIDADSGLPYHSVEEICVEAPDYGHVTTSEALSYYMWLEAIYGRYTNDFKPFKEAWAVTEKWLIPDSKHQLEKCMASERKATYSPEMDDPSEYPVEMDSSAPVGADPLGKELASAYGTSLIYAMHWLVDVDNWYGFGDSGDPVYINTFQRGTQESVWETVPQPCWETLEYGKEKEGFLSIFTIDPYGYKAQFKYTMATDADARAIQATYWAYEFGGDAVKEEVAKASKMGDYLRYGFFDKYFRKIGLDKNNQAAMSKDDGATYLLNWYYAWGGSGNESEAWSWIIGSSHNHQGYQNAVAAYALGNVPAFKPKSSTGQKDWQKSEERQIEFFRWLQTDEGAIAGGATNSWKGRYAKPSDSDGDYIPEGATAAQLTSNTFYGLVYDWKPVYSDPPSNNWFGMQVWNMQRVAEYAYRTKDSGTKASKMAAEVANKWAKWAMSETTFEDGNFKYPMTLSWSGCPDKWDPSSPGANSDLHVGIVDYGQNCGTGASYANTLAWVAALNGDNELGKEAARVGASLLECIYETTDTGKGYTNIEEHPNYTRFFDKVYIPSGWSGTMPNGDKVDSSSTFLSIRSKYKTVPGFDAIEAYGASGTGEVPKAYHHRFWEQSEIAIAAGTYGWLLDEGVMPTPDLNIPGLGNSTPVSPSPSPTSTSVTGKKGDVNGDGSVDIMDAVALKKHILGTKLADVKLADVNGDGSVDIMDATALKKIILGMAK